MLALALAVLGRRLHVDAPCACTSLLLLAGQTSTQTPQPVQSSGATWMVSAWPGQLARAEGLASGSRRARPPAPASGYTFMRIAACGQHERALAAVDAERCVPDRDLVGDARASRSARCRSGRCRRRGSAETGSRSPLPASKRAVTRCTKSGASAGTRARRRGFATVAAPGRRPVQRVERALDGGEVALPPRRARACA